MLMNSMTVFDEFIAASTMVFTSSNFIEALGEFDLLSLQVIIDRQSGAGTITVQIQHAADARNFVNKNATAEITGMGTGPGTGTIAATGTSICSGADVSGVASLAYVRLAINTAGAPAPSAHVRVLATARDLGGGSGKIVVPKLADFPMKPLPCRCG